MRNNPKRRGFVQGAHKSLSSLRQRPLIKRMTALKRIFVPVFCGLTVFFLLLGTGLGDRIGENLAALIGPLPAALVVAGISFIPIFSPLIGPGLIIVLAVGLLTGEQIAAALVTPFMALPALFAVDARINGGFISRGMAFGENEKDTINAGVPGIVFTRLILLPAAVLLVCLISFGW
ncbi:hypothetical protein AGMMS50230_11450 [Spirochaetia bacterium]|nr:hypothetical protein AGMMS50230_11450 [Spirochaetia bacterium]